MQVPRIIKVKDLLSSTNITIPDYQRPYKWTAKNVNQLIDDILLHKDKSAYRLGTIVFHKEDENLNIVDGQQRTITLLLIAHCIANHDGILKNLKKEKLKPIESELLASIKFKSISSKKNIQANHREINRRIKDFHDENNDAVSFFYEHCELVEVVLRDVTEAFQFFDSQNARGRDLYPHDLLKAFHLREMQVHSTEEERIEKVKDWESMDTSEVTSLFSNYLYRIRNWSKGKAARIFSKDDVDIFKGVCPNTLEPFPFVHIYRIGHFFTDEYNNSFHRKIDGRAMDFPHQLDQIIINGKRFFEYVEHYKNIIAIAKNKNNKELSELSLKILNTVNTYPGRKRDGDKYVRNIFDCALIYYIDKFGNREINRAIETFFLWSYSLRLTLQSVYLASIDNYALNKPFVFYTIREALKPSDVFIIRPEKPKINFESKLKPVIALFKELGYA